MITIHLAGQKENLWKGENPAPRTFPHGLLYHQWRTYQAEEPIIVNTMNTGMGKTKAALLRMLKRAQKSHGLSPTQENVLLVAPTNELIAQHVRDARQFCLDNDLPYRVTPLTKETIDQLIADYRAGFPNLPPTRRSAGLLTFLRDSSKIDGDFSKTADLWVVNPDIFHYAITFGYNPFDRSQLFNALFDPFNYLIFDEFHYYDAKQLATFLFFMKYSQHCGYLGSKATQRQFCLLTATPRPEVKRYLEGLGEAIGWIEPGDVAPEDRDLVEPIDALAPVQLQLYSSEELQANGQMGGLLQLVKQKGALLRQEIGQSRNGEPVEGAIISHAKGTISLIHQELLRIGIDPQLIGCITGADHRERRNEAKEKALILATPTVDIGYNFERSRPKSRQNIDVLFLDADFQDELFQRLGRAARVLDKECRTQKSVVYAVVPPVCYELVRALDQATLERPAFVRLLEAFPSKNDLSAYLRTGALRGLYLAFDTLSQGMSESDREVFSAFLKDLSDLFGNKAHSALKVPSLREMRGAIARYNTQQKHYGEAGSIPLEMFALFRDLLSRRDRDKRSFFLEQAEKTSPGTRKLLEAWYQRLYEQDARQQLKGKTPQVAQEWLAQDLRQYVIEKARMNFREGFQSPQALVYDPQGLHSSDEVATYNALHFVRYYDIISYPSLEEWQTQTGQRASESKRAESVAYFRLRKLREEPLQIALKLEKREETRARWEEQHAYQLTALHGLEVVPARDHHGWAREIRELFREQLIVAFVARNEQSCHTWKEIYRLQKQARLYPMTLSIDFSDVLRQPYLVILGTMAFHVCSEIPWWARARDLGKAQLEDDTPFIC